MQAAQVITVEVINSIKYVTTEYRGTEYTLRRWSDAWGVSTRRIGYGGRFHIGGFKSFRDMAALASGCKAFGTAENIAALMYGLE